MARRVALFRGINVGGHNRVPMAELRAGLETIGFTDVATIIQSGNVVFATDRDAEDDIAAIRALTAERFGVDVPVLVREATDFAAALAAHPFPVGELEPKMHHVVFLAGPAPADAAERLGDHRPGTEFVVDGREIHVRYPGGSGRSTFTIDLIDRRLETVATGRNLPTCTKIAALLAQ